MVFCGGSDGKESTCNAGDLGLILGLGRSPGGGHGNPLQYSCLENPTDRGAWRATVHGIVIVRQDCATNTFTSLQPFNNVVLVSTVQQSESATHIHISTHFWISFQFRSPQSIQQSALSVQQVLISYFYTYAKSLQSCLTLCDPMDCSPPGSSVHGDSPNKNTGVGCHIRLQGILPTQGMNPGLLHCRWILYHLSHHRNNYSLFQ